MKSHWTLPVTVPALFFLALAATPACSSGGDTPGNTGGDAAAHTDAAPASEAPEGTFVGKITETMDAGQYTYVRVESGEEAVWAAGPQTKVTVGDEVTIPLVMEMKDFHSETLDRTFPELYFVNSLSSDAPAPSDPHGGMAMGDDPHGGMAQGGNPHANVSSSDAPEVDMAAIALPDGGHRIADLWGGRTRRRRSGTSSPSRARSPSTRTSARATVTT